MRTLECKRIGPNISLYVAGDLLGESEREVALHLVDCDDCRRLSEEFSESSSLLARACSPTEFGAEFYAGIRSAVLADIGSRRSKPSLFRPRWLYATAFAAVVIVSAVMLQHFSSARRQAVQSRALASQVTARPRSDRAKATDLSSSSQLHGPSGTRGVQARGKFEPAKRLDASDTAQAARIGRAQLARAIESPVSVGPVALESAPVADGSASSPSGRVASPQVSRIEIQTANPNIRIIWLTPREASEDTNRDQEQHKNGTRK